MKRTKEISKKLFIEELERPAMAATDKKATATTLAIGEEACGGTVTTMAVGEECLKW
jgi:hypothetical protein